MAASWTTEVRVVATADMPEDGPEEPNVLSIETEAPYLSGEITK